MMRGNKTRVYYCLDIISLFKYPTYTVKDPIMAKVMQGRDGETLNMIY